MTILAANPSAIRIIDGYGKVHQGKPGTIRIVDRKQQFPVRTGYACGVRLRRDPNRFVFKSQLLDGYRVLSYAELDRICATAAQTSEIRDRELLDASLPYGAH